MDAFPEESDDVDWAGEAVLWEYLRERNIRRKKEWK